MSSSARPVPTWSTNLRTFFTSGKVRKKPFISVSKRNWKIHCGALNREDHHEDLHDLELEWKRSARQPVLYSVLGVNLEDLHWKKECGQSAHHKRC